MCLSRKCLCEHIARAWCCHCPPPPPPPLVQTSGFLCQYVTVNANEYMKRCRAMYKIAGVPRETDKFFRALQFSMEAAKADSVLAMNW